MPPPERKRLSEDYVQRKEAKRRYTITASLIVIVIGIAVGIYMSRHSLKLLKPIEIDIKTQSVGFKERSDSWGTQAYTASAQRTADVGGRSVTPKVPCSDMLVVTLKPSLKNVKVVQGLFDTIDPAITVEVTPTKIIANRTCDELRDVEQRWSLEDVWKEIEPPLKNHFDPKK